MKRNYIKTNYIKSKKKGFTLMELLVSLGIVAALSMMVAPMIIGKVDEAKEKADISNANAIAVAVKTELIEGANISGTVEINDSSSIATEYFDGKGPKAQSVDSNPNFTVTVSTDKKLVTVKAGSMQFYPSTLELSGNK